MCQQLVDTIEFRVDKPILDGDHIISKMMHCVYVSGNLR